LLRKTFVKAIGETKLEVDILPTTSSNTSKLLPSSENFANTPYSNVFFNEEIIVYYLWLYRRTFKDASTAIPCWP
jgi:hypothetical protein